MSSLVLRNGIVVTVDDNNRILTQGTVCVDDGRITAVEPSTSETTLDGVDHIIDVDGKLVIPGLIDAHRHADFTLVQGLFSELQGSELLKEAIALYHNAESVLDESFSRTAWRLATLRQLTHGVTTVNAMDFTPEIGAEILADAGVRGVIGPELADLIKSDSPEEQLEDARAFIEEYHGAADGRIQATIAPGGEAGYSTALWEGVADLRSEYPELRLHTHLRFPDS